MGSLSEWNYGRDPIAPLRFEKSLNALKDKIARREPVFQDLIKNYILSNNHKVTVSLVPKPGMESQVYEEETNRLATAKDSFSAEELASLRKQTVDLKASQALRNSPEELATLPTLSKDDLDRKTKPVPIEELDLGRGATLLTHDLQTDGVVYLDVALDMSRIALNDIPLVPLLTAMMSSLGTKTESEVDFSRRTGAQTGGVGISTFTSAAPESDGSVGERDSMYAYVVLRGRGTREKVKELFSISSEKLTSIDLDARERVLEMLKEAKVGTESSIASSGNSYAANQISSRFTLSAHVAELMGGLSQFETIKQAIQDAESDWPSFRDRLERMRTALLSADGTIVNLSADGASLKDAMDFVPGLISSLPDTSNDVASKWQLPTLDTAQKNEGLMVGSTKVNFVAKGCPIYEPGEKISGSASVVSRYLRTAYLWDKVRVQGGAYGCNLGFSRFNGVAMFSSYRDPNIADTLAAYDGTADFLRSNPISEEELTKAIIGAIGDLDSPQALDSKGYSSMLRWIMGVPEKRRQELRNEVIDTTAADFLAFAERLDAVAAEGSVAVVGSKRSLGDANYALGAGKQLEIREVLE